MKSILVFLCMILITAGSVSAQEWSMQFSGGSAYNFRSALQIEQAGEEPVNVNAEYGTKLWDSSPYFAARIGRWEDDRAWELELVHHKLYLKNETADVQQFSFPDGFNLVTLNRAWKRRGIIYRLGLGAVIAQSDGITVRGETRDSKYRVAGPTAQFSIEKRFYFKKRFFASLEGKVTASYAHIPVAGGDADLSNVAVHGLFGFGIRF